MHGMNKKQWPPGQLVSCFRMKLVSHICLSDCLNDPPTDGSKPWRTNPGDYLWEYETSGWYGCFDSSKEGK